MNYNPYDLYLRLLQGPDLEIPVRREIVPGVELRASNWHAEPSPGAIGLYVNGNCVASYPARDATDLDTRDALIEDLNGSLMIVRPEFDDAMDLLWDFLAFDEPAKAYAEGKIEPFHFAEKALQFYNDIHEAIFISFEWEMRKRQKAHANDETN